jgi:hypothetical protein
MSILKKEPIIESARKEYNESVCGACPYCEGGLEGYAFSSIPCTLWRGSLYRLRKPNECAVIKEDIVLEKDFKENMAKEFGIEILNKWIAHRNVISQEQL